MSLQDSAKTKTASHGQYSQLSFFANPSIDHALAGLSAGVVSVLCMHPLDLLKIKFQTWYPGPLSWHKPKYFWQCFKLGLIFSFVHCTQAKTRWGFTRVNVLDRILAMLCSSAATALITNPIWVVKVRMFTTKPDSPGAYHGSWHGLSTIARTEGLLGLWRGTWLALFGVSNGAIQFMAYEQMKKWGFAHKRREFQTANLSWTAQDDRLSNAAYISMSAMSKLVSLVSTYPYQVVRSRIQNNATAHLYPNVRACIRRTWAEEGVSGFYRGLGTNLIRVLPGNCVTFVVYENLVWVFRKAAARRQAS